MPVRLFTFHGYRTWMPDHERGYARRDIGVVTTDANMAYRYAARARHDEVRFERALAGLHPRLSIGSGSEAV